jgi:acyl-coenzyme A thioesterase PaaI-like protein
VRPAGLDDSFLHLFGEIRVRPESAKTARVRFATHRGLRNFTGGIHGGFLLAVVDQALFVGPTACGFRAFGGATVDVSSQFLATVAIGPEIDAVVEVLRETGRFLFVRGLIEQDGEARLAFSGTVRKPS